MPHASLLLLPPPPLSPYNALHYATQNPRRLKPPPPPEKKLLSDSPRLCGCGRRHLLGGSGAAFLQISQPNAKASSPDPMNVLNKVHPQRPDWYEEFYAFAMDRGMQSYEAEIAGYKAELFSHLKGDSKKVLEVGVGTGPNFKYYGSNAGMTVFGVDPNKQMEKYARAASVAAGLPPTHFSFMKGVVEALPLTDSSVDAVIGTLVLCSVKDVDLALKAVMSTKEKHDCHQSIYLHTSKQHFCASFIFHTASYMNKSQLYTEVKRVLKPGGMYFFIEHVAASDGDPLRLLQNVFDPLQQLVSDGCHLTRETWKQISEAGFSNLSINTVFLSTVYLVSPHVYGIACK